MTVPGKRPYDLVWEAFRKADTTADGRHDTAVWRSHAGPFTMCIVRVPADILQPGLDELRSRLSPLAGVRLHPDHFLHMTLQEIGFIGDPPERPDEISTARLEEFAHAAADALAQLAPFTIELGGANSFQDAVFLDVADPGPVARIHERLFDLAASPRLPAFAFLPHCTIAHYDGSTPVTAAAAAIAPWRTSPFGAFLATEIEIVTIDPAEPYPLLENYAAIPLGAPVTR